MAGKSVATQADVQTPQPGTTPFTGAASGTWTAGPVTVVSYAKLTTGSQPIISSVSCTFAFSGLAANGTTPVAGFEPVILSAAALGTTKLQGETQQVLRDGDQSNTSLYGNTISISSSEKLSSG
jgi:hypothetical protein